MPVAYAADLLLTEKAVSHEEVDAYNLGVFQLGVTGALNLIMALIVETPQAPQTMEVWSAVIFLSVFVQELPLSFSLWPSNIRRLLT